MKEKNIENQINEYLELYTNLWAFSGSIAAIKNGNVIFKKAYGYANIEHKVKNTIESKYRIWSITKQFTAAAILILEERRLLKVEDSIKKHFPNWSELNSEITIHHLLTHTSGIFNYSTIDKSKENFQRVHHEKSDLIKMFISRPLDFEPGTQWSYSNTGYYILGMLIEELSGFSYSQFLNKNIFLPLGMLNTGVDDDKKIVENKASGYYLNGNDLIHCNHVNMNLILSSGGMYSTVEDLILWDQALSNNKLLSKKSIEKMNTQYKNNYGYGIFINMHGNKRVVQHSGSCEGFLSEIHRYIDNDFAVVVLSNYGFTAVNKICKDITAIAFKEKCEIPKKPPVFPLSSEILKSYLGLYKEGDFSLELKQEREDIYIIINDEYILPVYPTSENILQHMWIDEQYTLTKDDNGELHLWGIKKK